MRLLGLCAPCLASAQEPPPALAFRREPAVWPGQACSEQPAAEGNHRQGCGAAQTVRLSLHAACLRSCLAQHAWSPCPRQLASWHAAVRRPSSGLKSGRRAPGRPHSGGERLPDCTLGDAASRARVQPCLPPPLVPFPAWSPGTSHPQNACVHSRHRPPACWNHWQLLAPAVFAFVVSAMHACHSSVVQRLSSGGGAASSCGAAGAARDSSSGGSR